VKPTLAEAHYRLARAYSHLGRHDDAAKEIALQQRYSKDGSADHQITRNASVRYALFVAKRYPVVGQFEIFKLTHYPVSAAVSSPEDAM
jgi:hypothetical protein